MYLFEWWRWWFNSKLACPSRSMIDEYSRRAWVRSWWCSPRTSISPGAVSERVRCYSTHPLFELIELEHFGQGKKEKDSGGNGLESQWIRSWWPRRRRLVTKLITQSKRTDWLIDLTLIRLATPTLIDVPESWHSKLCGHPSSRIDRWMVAWWSAMIDWTNRFVWIEETRPINQSKSASVQHNSLLTWNREGYTLNR